jgi:hypothetical protein
VSKRDGVKADGVMVESARSVEVSIAAIRSDLEHELGWTTWRVKVIYRGALPIFQITLAPVRQSQRATKGRRT